MTTQAQTRTLERRQLSVWLAIFGLGCAGALAGLLAQYLRQKVGSGGAFTALGGSMAIWVSIGFVLARQAAAFRPARDRIAWVSVAAAAYLFAWLVAYHWLLGAREQLDFAQVWPQMRYWVVAVAPACLVLGFIATQSLRSDVLGDICLALPLAWSFSEIYSSLRVGGSHVAVVSIPTLIAASLPLLALRRRSRWSLLAVVVTVLVIGIPFHFLYPHLSLDA